VAELNRAGIPCGVLIAPVLPGITDRPRMLREVVAAALDAGATHVSPILLHLRPGVREVFMEWLEDAYPDLVERYGELYARPYGTPAARRELGTRVGSIVRSMGGLADGSAPGLRSRAGSTPDPDAPAAQLTLI
jgi:DNA repair photolyase